MTAEAEIEDGEAAPEATKKKGRFSKKLIIMVAGGLLALLVAGAAVYFFVLSGKPAEQTAEVAAEPESFIFNLPPMTVNLQSENGKEQFMKLTVALEVADEHVMEKIQPRLAKVVDAFQVYLRALRKGDLEGSAGVYRLKEELRRRVNVAIYPEEVQSILFKEILVQ